MNMVKKAVVLAVFAIAGFALARAGVTADRFGALYYPGETAAFTTDGTGVWSVTDWTGAACATGTVERGAVSVPHAALGNRYGAFRMTVGTNETWFAFLRSKGVKPCGWVGVGTHGGHGWGRGDYRYLDLLAAAGVGVVRDDVIWDGCEKKKGEYVFDARLRDLVDGLYARGIKFHPVLNGQNNIYADPLDADAYANFAAAFVREFKGKVTSCDIFNEPHNFAFPKVYLPEGGKFSEWQCRADAPWIPKHAAVTRKAVDAIRAVDPTFSAGVGVEDYWGFFKHMLKGDLVRADDLVSLHPYDHEHYPPEGNWFFKDGGKEVREYLKEHGGATRLAFTECGWTTYDAKRDATHAFVGNYPPCTYVQQAQYLIRFWILARQHGIEFACQYDFMDDGPKRNYTEDNFGLVRQDYTPKPSFAALAMMTRLIGDAKPLGSLSKDEASCRLYAFHRGNNVIVAAWSPNGTAVADVPKRLDLATARCLDLQGNAMAVPARDGKLHLTEMPVYLVFPLPKRAANERPLPPASGFALDSVFGDHMVLQRRKPIRFSGWGNPGSDVTVALGGAWAVARVDESGRWALELPPREAGGPYDVVATITAPAGGAPYSTVRLEDVMVGEVWLASGQSNMEFWVLGGNLEKPPFFHLPDGEAVAETRDPLLRLLYVPHAIAPDAPCAALPGGTGWKRAETRAANGRMSAVAWWFARHLREQLDVPVGVIDASWGGTRIEPWTSEEAFAWDGWTNELEKIASFKSPNGICGECPSADELKRERMSTLKAWIEKFEATDPAATAAARATWAQRDIPLDGWKVGPRDEMKGLNAPGVVWYRFPFTVPAGWQGAATVHFDFVNDCDETYLDGVKIGATGIETPGYWSFPRDYAVASLGPGEHVVAVRAEDHFDVGGFGHRAYVRNEATGEQVALGAGDWQERVEFRADLSRLGVRPACPWDSATAGTRFDLQNPSVLFNGMVAPVTAMNIGGAIWYQGCANHTEGPLYGRRQRLLIDDWRRQFRDDALPFLITQLAAYEAQRPGDRLPDDFWRAQTDPARCVGFGPIRLVQDECRTYPRTGVACTIDIGDHSDIHPANKREVGRRLAHEAMRIAFGDTTKLPGPRGASAVRDGAAVIVDFEEKGGGLALDGGGTAFHPHLFALAGADGNYHWADGELLADGRVKVTAAEVAEPKAVQYCVSGYPPGVAFRRTGDGIPVYPFELRVKED